jgi:tetratricopeptide (TPR) repeat protein
MGSHSSAWSFHMQRLSRVLLLAAFLLAGCIKQTPQDPRSAAQGDSDAPPVRKDGPAGPTPVVDPGDKLPADGKTYEALVSSIAAPTKQQQYDAALVEALGLLGQGKQAEALAALENARSISDTPEIRQQIDALRTKLAQQNAARRTVQDIRTVLADGDAKQASELAQLALRQYGDTDVAPELANLKQQADALIAAPMADNAARRALFEKEADTAFKDNNLRGAAIAYEQALQLGGDAALRKKCDDIRDALARYDDNRRRAADLRRDPANLEDALAALQEAVRAWDTPQVRMEIDECSLALQRRRDRLSVADFEVRGDVGAALAGKTLAEDLLPAFKSRFDLVERDQLCKVLDELKLEAGTAADSPEGRDAVVRLAKVRYLVVGSLTPQQGVTVHARLVDVRSGLVVQTARLSAPSLDALTAKLPQLAQVLTMTDEQKLAFEQQLAAAEAAVKPIEIREELPPPPPAVIAVDVPPPPPIITYTTAPPAFGGIAIEDFRRLPAVVVEPPPPPAIEVVLRREDPRRQRLFQLSIEIGDNLFRRGRHAEANRHFQLALSLATDRREVEARIELCRPHLPPPPPVVVVPEPVVVVPPPPTARPRLAVFNFYVNAAPGLVPPAADSWAADCFASYCGRRFEIIDRGEVCWYMGRLGITMKDVLGDPGARVALAQALNARYFVFGAMVQTHSFDVTTDMIDAQSGARTGTGMIHVQDHSEMKLRMNELFDQLNLPPEQQAKVAQQAKDNEKLLNDVRKLQQDGKYAQAADAARAALKANPSSVALQQQLADNERRAEQARLAEARKQDEQHRQAELAAAREREQKLAKQAEQARLLAEAEAKARSEATRRSQETAKKRAYDQFISRGRDAMQRNDYAAAVQAFQGATALVSNDDGFRELAGAKAKAEQAARDKAALEQRQREEALKKERDAALARVEAERKQREADEAARRKAQQDRDDAEYAKRIAEAKQALAKQQYDAARAAAGAARLLKGGAEVDALLRQIGDEQALADAKKKSEQARLEEEKRQAAERQKRADAEAAAKKKQEQYTAALARAQKALGEKKYDEAVAAYQEAGQVFRTDAALSGLKQAQELRDRDRREREAAEQQKAEEQKKAEQVRKLLADGQKALDAKQYDQAVQIYHDANKLAPGNVDVLAALSKAEHARDDFARANRQKVEAERAQKVKDLVAGARRGIGAKDFNAADQALSEAVKLAPTDPDVVKAQQELAAARKADADAKAAQGAEAKRREELARLVKGGQAALAAKKYDEASRLFGEALKVQPGDAAALKGQRDAQAALDAAKHDAEAKKRQADYQNVLAVARAALAAKKYDEAIQHANEALKLAPGDKDATALLKDAEKARSDAKAAQEAEARKRDNFNKAMTAGQAALTAKRYADAVKAYTEATQLYPSDAAAQKALKDAKAALDASKVPPPPNPKAEYDKHMAAGAAHEKQKQWAEAAAAYKEALKQMPGDAKATAALKNAEFQQHMAEGQKLAGQKKFAEAAKEYEEALKLFPDNKDAKDALKRAKDGKP